MRLSEQMIPTPSTDHVSFERVYEPSEDSFLLLDTLSSASEKLFLQRRLYPHKLRASRYGPVLITEIGTGSGVVLAFITAHAKEILGNNEVMTLGVDINPFACKASIETIAKACLPPGKNSPRTSDRGFFLDQLTGDLSACFKAGSVDILVFNPPYVPTDSLPDALGPTINATAEAEFDRDSRLLALSYAGGADGMVVTDRLLGQIPNILSERGVAFVLLCAQNKPDEVKRRIGLWPGGWNASTIGSSGKTGGWEKLQILRIWRT
ncbi:MAG: S-adenosylmethionine-dependent methyltransferase [Vezdaea aestivalis]|nr:MAG: S-adenosylmethionine-dependent methyltransferase [Vezdaea aestivalis]